MKNFEQFKKDFKRDLLVKAIINMKYGKSSKEYSSQLARKLIEIMSVGEAKQVFTAINKLAETNPDVLDIFIKRVGEFEQRDKIARLDQIHIFLKPLTQTAGGEIN